jgi:hypothetical protein
MVSLVQYMTKTVHATNTGPWIIPEVNEKHDALWFLELYPNQNSLPSESHIPACFLEFDAAFQFDFMSYISLIYTTVVYANTDECIVLVYI